jgi:dihydrofolate synthase/folylpolyglutamate synthase
MNFQEAQDLLYSLIDYEKKTAVYYGPPAYDLDSYRDFLAELDDPHEKVPFPILIAGTKGKGSTAAMLASAIQQGGQTVGVFTSPHLRSVLERFQVDGEPMGEEEFAGYIEELWPLVEGKRTRGYRTVFEVLTAIAFLHFARRSVDVSILEVGVGGRLDSTNVVDPEISVITSIGLDHTDLLGRTVEAIAQEKAGIIRRGRPVFSSPQLPPAREVIETVSSELGAELSLVGRDVDYRLHSQNLAGQRFEVTDRHGAHHEFHLPLLGRFQLENACLAFSVLDRVSLNGVSAGEEVLRRGFGSVLWPGRFQLVSQHPPIVLDGAHNPSSARALARSVEELLPGRRRILVMGIMGNKDVEGVLDELTPHFTRLIATQASTPRALEPTELAALARMRMADVEVAPDAPSAMKHALDIAGSDDPILVAGSFYLVGEVLEFLEA